jgi:hypothetical protein
MSKKKKNNKPKVIATWSSDDYQAFADRNILRSTTIPNKRRLAGRNACRNKLAWD